MLSILSPYRKTLAAVIGAVVTWGTTAQVGGFDSGEWWGLAAAIATAVGVYRAPNDPPAGEPADPDQSERGATDVTVALLGLAIGVTLGLLLRRTC